MLRVATPDDMATIAGLLAIENPGRVAELLGKGQICVALRSGQIVGTLGLDLSPFKYFTRTLKAEVFYIAPDHREDVNAAGENGGHAARLIAWAKAGSNRCGIPLLMEKRVVRTAGVDYRWLCRRMSRFDEGFIHYPRAA